MTDIYCCLFLLFYINNNCACATFRTSIETQATKIRIFKMIISLGHCGYYLNRIIINPRSK